MDKRLNKRVPQDGETAFGERASTERVTRLEQPAAAKRNPGATMRIDSGMVPPEAPLLMPEQDITRPADTEPVRAPRNIVFRRLAVFGAAGLATLAFALNLHQILSLNGVTGGQFVFLILATLAFAWIALGTASIVAGFFALALRRPVDTLELPGKVDLLTTRTALLFPVYHEDPAYVCAAIDVLAKELARRGHGSDFAVFLLSDSRRAECCENEDVSFKALRWSLRGVMKIYFRRRPENTAKKAGNIADWVGRHGGAYDHFIIFDADSVMSADTVLRLAAAMEAAPATGLIQTVPRITGAGTVFARLQAFASAVYGPMVAAGLAFWTGRQGNYWGHNAIIRTEAFASSAGLPELPGRAPLGGHIQSHDFVEAALLQRAGWEVHMAPSDSGSFEGCPPSLIDMVVRDRRWCQGNLQHMQLVVARGLSPMGRVHLAMGALSYLISAIWALSLLAGFGLAIVADQMQLSYFGTEKGLFPIWPVMDSAAAVRLFIATSFVVLLPKILGLLLALRDPETRAAFGGARLLCANVLAEAVLSVLFAPILMVTQSTAIVQILLFGSDSGWSAQRRDDGGVPLASIARFHWLHTAIGIAVAWLALDISAALFAWMLPVIAGLVLAIPLSWATARPLGQRTANLLITPDERCVPQDLLAVNERIGEWQQARHQSVTAVPKAMPSDIVPEPDDGLPGRRAAA